MKIKVSVPDVVATFKEIQSQPENLLEIPQRDIRALLDRYCPK